MNCGLKPLIIKDLEIPIPIFQGGMGVKVSTASLASAVANCGCAGTLSSIGLGSELDKKNIDYIKESNRALKEEINLARRKTNGVIGVNIMFALSNYDDLVCTSVEEKVDFIASGAGLALKLPEFTKNTNTKIIPIVSSARALKIIFKTWHRRYNVFPDAVIVEGKMAGGHLGFKVDELKGNNENSLEVLVADVIEQAKLYEKEFNISMPVIAAGGIYNGKDILKYINLGAQGVQIATRFVATDECSVHENFKNLYVTAKEEDVLIINSPVGLPGRVIRTKFTDKIARGDKLPIKCMYKCLKTCNPKNTPYCIAKALLNAARGNIDESIVFAGENVAKIDKIVPVKSLIEDICGEVNRELENISREKNTSLKYQQENK